MKRDLLFSFDFRSSIYKTIASGYMARAATFLPILLLPLLIVADLGVEKLGVLMTLISFQGILTLAEMGIGSHSLNEIAAAEEKNKQLVLKKVIQNSFPLALLISIFLLGVSFLFYSNLIVDYLFKDINYQWLKEANDALAMLVLLYAFSLPLLLVYKLQFSINAGYIANTYQTFASLLNFVAAYMCITKITDNLSVVVFSMSIGTLTFGMINALFFLKRNIGLLNIFTVVKFQVLLLWLKSASPFFMLQLIYIVTYSLDTVILSNKLGASSVPIYTWTEKLFSISTISASIIITPLWVIYGNKISENKANEAYGMLKIYTLRTITLTMLVLLSLIAFLYFIMPHMRQDWYIINTKLIVGLLFWKICEVLGMSLVVFMHALKLTRKVLYMGLLTAVTSFLLKTIFVEPMGVSILPIITAICYIFFCLLPMLYYIPNRVVDL